MTLITAEALCAGSQSIRAVPITLLMRESAADIAGRWDRTHTSPKLHEHRGSRLLYMFCDVSAIVIVDDDGLAIHSRRWDVSDFHLEVTQSARKIML